FPAPFRRLRKDSSIAPSAATAAARLFVDAGGRISLVSAALQVRLTSQVRKRLIRGGDCSLSDPSRPPALSSVFDCRAAIALQESWLWEALSREVFMSGTVRSSEMTSSPARVRPLILVTVSFVAAFASWASAATLTSDKTDYGPGEIATFTGDGFQPGELVLLQVVHDDSTPNTGESHGTWLVQADPEDGAQPGGFVTTWTVCSDDCLGPALKATPGGLISTLTAWVVFTAPNHGHCPSLCRAPPLPHP